MEGVYAIRLNEHQLAGIRALFTEKGWKLELDTIDRYKEKESVAGDYVDMMIQNSRASPKGNTFSHDVTYIYMCVCKCCIMYVILMTI